MRVWKGMKGVGVGEGGGSLGADQGHCAFHKPRSATQTPPPLCVSQTEERTVDGCCQIGLLGRFLFSQVNKQAGCFK